MIYGSAASEADFHDPLAASRRKISNYLAAALFAACTGLPSVAVAKPFISYFQPTPTACPVTSKTWGVSGVLPRDTCNGLENTNVPPQYYYWDGKIIPSPDGKYYQLPWKSNPVMIFYNKKEFTKAGISTTAPPLSTYSTRTKGTRSTMGLTRVTATRATMHRRACSWTARTASTSTKSCHSRSSRRPRSPGRGPHAKPTGI